MIEDFCSFVEDVEDGYVLAVRVHPGAKTNVSLHSGQDQLFALPSPGPDTGR